jgi:hypothetical protein
MNNFSLYKIADLNQARIAMAKLLPQIPRPRLAEQIDDCGIAMPRISSDSTALPVLEYPRSFLADFGDLTDDDVPATWKSAYAAHKLRLRRNGQLVRLHPLCQYAAPSVFAGTDGMVAGALLLCLRPLPGPMRSRLIARAQAQPWGAFLAAHGLVIRGEEPELLHSIAQDPRLAAALWRSNSDLAEPLLETALLRSDLWSATMLLDHAQAGPWLRRVLAQAANNEVAAITALILQPLVGARIQAGWIDRIKQPHLAYWAVRWTRHTWHPSQWQHLLDQLRATALSDGGSSWYHWHRDLESDRIAEALADDAMQIPWACELVDHSQTGGQALRRRMLKHDDELEARLVLRWLDRRGKGQP